MSLILLTVGYLKSFYSLTPLRMVLSNPWWRTRPRFFQRFHTLQPERSSPNGMRHVKNRMKTPQELIRTHQNLFSSISKAWCAAFAEVTVLMPSEKAGSWTWWNVVEMKLKWIEQVWNAHEQVVGAVFAGPTCAEVFSGKRGAAMWVATLVAASLQSYGISCPQRHHALLCFGLFWLNRRVGMLSMPPSSSSSI